MPRKAKYVQTGDPTLADQYNDLVDDIGSLENRLEEKAREKGLRQTSGPFLAQLLTDSGSGTYSTWREVYRNDANNGWDAKPGGRTEVTTLQSLYEFSGIPNIPVGTTSKPVWVYPTRDSNGNVRYMFSGAYPGVIAAKLTAEPTTSEYEWEEWAPDWSGAVGGGLTHSNTGFHAYVGNGLTDLPTTNYQTRVLIFPIQPDGYSGDVWQAIPVLEDDGERLVLYRQSLGEASAAVAETDTWDREEQDTDDKEGVDLSVVVGAHYQYPASESSDGEINMVRRSTHTDLTGALERVEVENLETLATVSMCPAMPTSAAAGIAGYYV